MVLKICHDCGAMQDVMEETEDCTKCSLRKLKPYTDETVL